MDQKQAVLEAWLASLDNDWGDATPQPFSNLPERPSLPNLKTGFEILDAVLGDQGISRGQVTEIISKQTSGGTSLTYNIVAAAHQQSEYAVYVDLDASYNPIYAKLCGIDQNLLFLARPDTAVTALDIARDLIQQGSVGVIVLDLGETQPNRRDMRRLATRLSRFGCVVVLLQIVDDEAALRAILRNSSMPLRLLVERDAWITKREDVIGYRSQVTVTGRYQGAGKRVTIDINVDLDGKVV